MGLLDDAIRQHLELKRRHGADPSDVARLEHEAFGPIEREDALEVGGPAPASEATHALVHEEELAHEEAELEAQEEELADEEAELETEEEWAAEAAAPPPAPPHRLEPEPVEPEPGPRPEPLRRGGSFALDDTGERTVPFSPGEPDPRPDAELDELEETPEFLQETPEHDRLWFEQKPPRDFDF